ncbi:HpcH/HpaI aldolase/citrate lyase family protein [Pseudomonas agarici]|uniref:HpcH/HpaI aldolase/citrate lyase family protein n=1 Tax=Pseudomonas agarici TaxID=46677 RepID=UPI00031641CD|nr:CoA ester lyase [Pseudomonas agarici]NWB92671.1 CoA ester lyase [Pseudomonas agarici]NWC10630.1 CoA ester lyase [Pseudomonas agarici]SEL11609.1 citrate lyase subunit beta / citryl-CoA lyase [Pseudomonas agarici]
MRSKLFVPGSRPELFAKALASKADAVSFDLEDAVDPCAKDRARQWLCDFLGTLEPTDKIIVVRVNDSSSPHYEHDLSALVGTAMQVINLPKVESAEQIQALAQRLDELETQHGMTRPIAILATIETPKGLRNAAAIAAASPRVNGLQLGLADLFEPLGIDRQDQWALHQIRLSLRLAAGEAGVATYDSAFARIDDPQGFSAEADTAQRLGYVGKSCIHPTQIDLANQAFLPNAEQIAHASRVVEAAAKAEAAGIGAYRVDGQMVDGPFVRSAQTLLARARSAGLLG